MHLADVLSNSTYTYLVNAFTGNLPCDLGIACAMLYYLSYRNADTESS